MRLAGSLVIEEIESTALRDNPLGDPHIRQTPVYLPPGYDSDAGRRYPAVYVLPGVTGTGLMLTNHHGWWPTIPERIDRLIVEGRCRPMIAVLVDAFTKYGGSQYISSEATGNYEEYLARDVVGWIDGRFRTLRDRNHRAVAGKSSGGYGALVHGMRNADVFAIAASHSGDAYFEYCYLVDFPKARDQVEKAGGVRKFWEQFWARPKVTDDNFQALNTLCMASCYSPNPVSPYGYDLPFDEHTGELRTEVWERWRGWDPVNMVAEYAEQLKTLRLLYIDCGTKDQFTLHQGTRILSRRLTEHGVPHEHQEFDDDHSEVAYRYEVSLSLISAAFGE
jgi:enterochelin esterase family protein